MLLILFTVEQKWKPKPNLMSNETTIGYVEALKILSPAEINVLNSVEKGHTNREIAKELFISVRTVHSHRYNICRKLGISGRNRLLKWLLWCRNGYN